MLIQACLNGSRAQGGHPALPCTPAELASAARGAVAAGARSLHLHPRAPDGGQSLALGHVTAALVAVRAACPGIPVGVSTLFAILPDVELRAAAVRQWDIRPDFASVNFSEPGAAELCAVLREAGVGVEAGLSSAADAERYLALGLGASCVRVLLEPEEADVAAALATVTAIERVLDGASDRTPRLLHGEGPTAWPLLDVALARGYDTRIGMEDVLTLPDGMLAPDNATLVQAAFGRLSVSTVSLRDVAGEDIPIFYAHPLPLRPLTAYVARQNLASRRVLEKCGFVLEREDEGELKLRLPKV